jgi:hydroxymethylbilane synthase
MAERSMNSTLEGGCSVAIGGYSITKENALELTGMVGNIDSNTILRVHENGSLKHPKELGEVVAQKLLAMGAGELLKGE